MLISFANAFRQCAACEQLFATKRGLKMHCSRNEQNECGRTFKKNQDAKKIKERALRNEKIHSAPMRRIGPHMKNLSSPRKRGSPLSKCEKEIICHIFDKHLGMVYVHGTV